MKVLLTVPQNRGSKESQAFPLGTISIATHLKNHGHTVKVFDRNISTESFEKILKAFSPDIVGFSVTIIGILHDAIKLSKTAKNIGAYVCWGGNVSTLIDPKIILNEDFIDFVSFGEGENTWLELLNCLEGKSTFDTIDGLAYKKDSSIFINKDRELGNLKDMPIIDWSLIQSEKYASEYMSCKRMGYIYSGKGCPFSCKFCCNKPLERCVYRSRPMEYVVQEILDLCDHYYFDGFYFMDEMWLSNRKDVVEKCNILKNINRQFYWGCMFKIGIARAEDYKIMSDAGCRWILFGIESGSPSLHKKMNKGLPFNKIEQSIKDASNAGIRPITSFILGYPTETAEEIKETIELVKKLLGYAIVTCNFFTPLVGSEVYNELVASGKLVEPKKLSDFKQDTFDFMGKNYSSIPDRDIKVIRAVLWLWSYFSDNKAETGISNKEAFISSITAVFRSMFSNGPKRAVLDFYYSSKLALSVLFNYFCFPKIRRKYNLYLDKK